MSLSKDELRRYFYETNLGSYQANQKNTKAKTLLGKSIAAEVARRLPNQDKTFRILDVGCGDGELAKELITSLSWYHPDLEIQLLAIDISEKVLDLAREKLKGVPPNVSVDFKQVGVLPPPAPRLLEVLGEKSFDLIVASFVMHWVDDIEDALEQFYQCLRLGGRLCVAAFSKREDRGKEYADFRRQLFKIAHGEETEYGPFQSFFAEDFEKIIKQIEDKKMILLEPTLLQTVVDLGSKDAEDIDERIEFLMAMPREKLTPVQKERVKQLIEKLPGKMPCVYKIIWGER